MRPHGLVALSANALLALVMVAACGPASASPASAPASPSPLASSSRSTGIGPSGVGSSVAPCTDDASWRCGVVSVPTDRGDPSLGTIPVHFYLQTRTDTAQPPLEPVFVSPGGPGASIWRDHAYLPMSNWQARHDTVLIEPRGVGASGVIDCPAIQAGVAGDVELRAAVRACAAILGEAAGRYGSGDVALDVEAVRRSLDVPAFDYYAASYGTVAAQAYAARFPDRLHALVLDSGFAMTDPAHSYLWGLGLPAAWIRVAALLCSRDASCAAAYRAPATVIEQLVHRVAAHPVRSPVATGALAEVVVDEAELEVVLGAIGVRSDQLMPAALLAAAAALDHGDPAPLLQLGAEYPIWPGSSGDPTDFSAGDNLAALCNDGDFVWNRADPVAVREDKLKAAIAAFPNDTFAPFTVSGWVAGVAPFTDLCLDWPAPGRFEPVRPAAAPSTAIPTLILSGDSDTNAPTELNRTLMPEFPGATFLIIAGAGHDSSAPFYGGCGGKAVALFLDVLTADPDACSTPGA